MDLVDPNLYITMLPEAMKKVDHEFNKAKIIELYNTIDFIGISSYAGITPAAAGLSKCMSHQLQAAAAASNGHAIQASSRTSCRCV